MRAASQKFRLTALARQAIYFSRWGCAPQSRAKGQRPLDTITPLPYNSTMLVKTRRLPVLCGAVFVVAFAIVTWLCFRQPEPTYQGKALSFWIDQQSAAVDTQEAIDAIRHIGTNAIPPLLGMVRKKDSAFKKRLITLGKKQSVIDLDLHPARYYHAKASCGFSILGPAAKPAVPALIALLHDNDKEVRASAAQCLAILGPDAREAVPALVQLLHDEGNGYGPVLLNAMNALGSIHAEPETVLPVLLDYVNGSKSNWNYHLAAISALGAYREEAKSVVPAILPFLNDPDPVRRRFADAALWLIDPQAAAAAARK